ncbi:DUF2157 domain-containing protein [Nocardia sp. NPDC003963]
MAEADSAPRAAHAESGADSAPDRVELVKPAAGAEPPPAGPGPATPEPGAPTDSGVNTEPGSTAEFPAAPDRTPAALRDLVDRGVLDETQLTAVVTALAQPRPRPTPARLLAEIAAYAGAGLLLSGLVLILVESWDDMARLGRVILFLLVAFGVTVAGIATAGGRSVLFRAAWRRGAGAPHTARLRLAMVLFALAAAAVAAAAGSAYDDGNTDTSWVLAAGGGLLAAVAGYAALPSLLGLLLCAGFGVGLVVGVLDEVLGIDDDWVGLGVLVLGLIWLALTRFGVVLEVWAGYLAGVALAVAGAQTVQAFDATRAPYVLTALVAVVCFGLYATDRSWVLVLGGAGALTLGAVEAVGDWTGESPGASGAILVIGAVILGIGSYLLTRSVGQDG